MGIENLLVIIKDYAPMDKEFIIRAYEYASKVHKGVKRHSGEPYITHPVAVACIAAEMHADVDTIVACILHDVIEDGLDITKEDLAREFNPTVAYLVDGVSKLPKLSINNNKIETDAFNLRKILLSMVTDIRVIIIKFSDRLHNMRTLEFHSPDKQVENSKETKAIYVPLANYIGAYHFKQELDDLSFKYLNPESYLEMQRLISEYRQENFDDINAAICKVSQLLNQNQIKFEVKLRVKSLHSLYEKLKKYSTIAEVHDVFSITFLLDSVEDCYKLRQQIYGLYPIVTKKERDYIKNPKTNMYSALHTSVYTPNNRLLQFQFTTKTMDVINTYGITAYWDLLKFNNAPEHMQRDVSQMPFFKMLEELANSDLKVSEFNKEVQEDILSESICVNTPNGDKIELPVGSTPIDFAYKIHGDIGDWITNATVNGERVPLDYKLRNNDVVNINFVENLVGPRQDLINMCKTNKAKRKIREFNNRWLKLM